MDPAVWLRGDEGEGGDGARLLSPYSQSAWIYIAVSLLAETVAQVPFRIARLPASGRRELNGPGGRRRDPDLRRRMLRENLLERGAAAELFEQPHPTMDRALFWEM